MDIDRFKDVNDSYGHEVGDLLLRAVAQRLAMAVRQSDTVTRMGGDEFVIVLETIHQAGDADAVAGYIQRAFAKAFTLERHHVKVTASIGISFYPGNGEDADTLLKAADRAMYLAKREGGNRHLTCLPEACPTLETISRKSSRHSASRWRVPFRR
jgi:diguanylate cyclase (GGDEF)-like protein